MSNVLENQKLICYHCGDDCNASHCQVEEKHFCCEGCKTVYELLSENDLCAYYDFEANPGVKIKAKAQDRFAYLDNPEIANAIAEFNDAGIMYVHFYIPKIHCASCVWLLENLYKIKLGVLSSQVNFVKREFHISFRKDKVSLRQVVELLDSFGYCPEINLESGTQQEEKIIDKNLVYKLGVAAFCSGNIMMMSFPSYFGLGKEDAFVAMFGYLSLLLSLPVVFYSGQDFFISAYTGLKNKTLNLDVPISMGIAAVFIRSLYEVFFDVGPGYFDSLTGLLFFMLIGKWYQRKTYNSFSFDRDYKSYFPISVLRIQNGKEVAVPVKDLKKGDLIVVRNQEIIPVDAILVSEEAQVDYSFVTGESAPVTKQKGVELYAGGRQMGGSIELEVTKEVSQSYLLQLWNRDVFKKTTDAYLSAFVLKFSKYFVVGTIIISLSTILYWYWVDPSKALLSFTAVLLVACPCALALSLPFALGNGLSKLGRKGLFLKSADSIEEIAQLDTLVFDKTGTLTSASNSAVEFMGSSLSSTILSCIKSAVKPSTHPLSRLIYAHVEGSVFPVEHFSEIPSKGIFCLVEGYQIEIGSAFWVGLEDEERIPNETKVYVSINGVIKGYYQIRSSYRDGVPELLSELTKKFDVHVISGDNEKEKAFLMRYSLKEENLKFRLNPVEKLRYVESLMASGKRVLMVGDGLNDAGALKAANVGVAISEDVSSFSPSCDGILEGNVLVKLRDFLRYSRSTVLVIKWSLVLSLMYNAAGLFFAVQGLLTPVVAAILMPMSSVTVVLFVVLATNFEAKRILKR